jgi:hypothetical protein
LGTSFTSYHGYGFWSRDSALELWLYLLAQEVDQMEATSEWLRAAAAEWHLQATGGFDGSVSAELNRHAPTPEQAAAIVIVAERALGALRTRGEIMPAAWLNSLGLGGPGSSFTKDVPTALFLSVGETFLRLLRGEVTWDAATSPVV